MIMLSCCVLFEGRGSLVLLSQDPDDVGEVEIPLDVELWEDLGHNDSCLVEYVAIQQVPEYWCRFVHQVELVLDLGIRASHVFYLCSSDDYLLQCSQVTCLCIPNPRDVMFILRVLD